MGSKGRWEYLRAIYERYRQARRKDKKAILSEFCANACYHRKYAIRLFNGPPPEKRPRPPRRRLSELRPGNSGGADQGVGGGWLSVVGAIEGVVAWLDALDPQTLWSATGGRQAVAENQSATDRSATESGQDPEAATHLRAHQAGLSAQAPHCGEDRPLGCAESWFHGSRPGIAFGEFRQWGVRAHAQRHRHSYDLDRIRGGAGARRTGRAAGFK